MRIILIGNYRPDRQESMLRFAHMLHAGFCEAGYDSEIWQPSVFFGAVAGDTTTGFGKWLGYLDKWIVFPLVLRGRLLGRAARRAECRFHICDHSNAPYLNHLPAALTSITCHDVLAIQGGLGQADAYVPASRLGKVLQAWILTSLSKAEKLAAVSHYTLDQLRTLLPAPQPHHQSWRVIHNAFNADFRPLSASAAQVLLQQIGFDCTVPFLLHVGSGVPRKNRALLLDMAAKMGEKWQGTICFAGKALDTALLQQADALGLRSRVISLVSPSHDVLVALYSKCAAFIFPSYSEGFGWPIIEAQACGAPVIASALAPMPEVSGGAALHAPPTDAQAFADAFLSLADAPTRARLVQAGLQNSHRFERPHMMRAYLALLALHRA